ncbi:MAG: helix-turn-helix domain-containing protein [Flavobacteriales bacterium]|nr:helix-turn-helix domain-containing protein [Flavobacteriales bacterium]
MKNDIPHVTFKPATSENFGFEIVPIEAIANKKGAHEHNSQLPHQLKFYNLIFFTEGKGRHFIDFHWYPVQQNTLVYIAKEQVNAFEFSAGLKGYCMVFTEDFFVNCFSNFTDNFLFRLFNPQLFSPIVPIPEESDFINYFNLLRKEFSAPKSVNQKEIIKSLLTILVSKVENIKQNQPEFFIDSSKLILFQKFTSLVENHYTESRNANFYADKLAITYKHLNITCKELMHKTAKSVIDDFIVLQAKRKLINADMKSTELAYDLGFEDPTNFTKYFKKQIGLTPISFIKSI